jgi:hypothetical protein
MHHPDLSSFQPSTVSAAARAEIAIWKPRMELLDSIGHGGRVKAARQYAGQWGKGASTLLMMLKRWKEHGDAALLDQRSHGRDLGNVRAKGQPKAFLTFWQQIYLRHHREGTLKTGWEELIARLNRWRRGDASAAIPGYDRPPRNQPGKHHPAGWSYANLTRFEPDGLTKSFVRQGRKSAKKLMHMVYHTRVGLRVGQVYMLDDQHHDVEVVFGNVTCRPLSFNVLDLLSGADIAQGYQASKDAHGNTIGLKEEQAWWLMLHVLSTHGYREDGTDIVVELGTATLRDELAQGLLQATRGAVRVRKGGVDNAALKGFVIAGRAAGNPNWKAARESWFNLLRNRSSMLIGAVGKDRAHAPEELDRKRRLVEKMFLAVPEHRRSLLSLNTLFLTDRQFFEMIGTTELGIIGAINSRIDHELEGWEACGFTRTEYNIAGLLGMGEGFERWENLEHLQQHMLSLPAPQQEALSTFVRGHSTELMRTRRLSPLEVWHEGRKELTRLSPWTWNVVMPARMARKMTARPNREFVIDDASLSPDRLRYDARCFNADNREIILRPGDEVLLYVNPFDTREVLCCGTNGKAIGILHQIQKGHQLADDPITLQRLGRVREMNADLEAGIAHLVEDQAEARQQTMEHNARIIEGKPVTPEEKRQARTTNTLTTAAARILTPKAPASQVSLPDSQSDEDDDHLSWL